MITVSGQNFGAVELGKCDKWPQAPRGWSVWIKNGIWFKAPTVSKKKFGGHDYANGMFEQGVRDCKCGCYMGAFSSSGPVDPFGACPLNPRKGPSVPAGNENQAQTPVSQNPAVPVEPEKKEEE